MLPLTTCIQAKAKRAALHQSFWPSLGLLALLLITPSFLSLSDFSWTGPSLFLVSIVGLAWIWRPYRKLLSLEKRPRTLSLKDDHIILSFQGTTLLSLHKADIHTCAHFSNKKDYGLSLMLTASALKNVLENRPDLIRWHLRSKSKHHCDFFFAYFTKSALASLQPHLTAF